MWCCHRSAPSTLTPSVSNGGTDTHQDCQNVPNSRLKIVKLYIRLKLKILRECWKMMKMINIIIAIADHKCYNVLIYFSFVLRLSLNYELLSSDLNIWLKRISEILLFYCLLRKWHVDRSISQRCVRRNRWTTRLRFLLHGVLQVSFSPAALNITCQTVTQTTNGLKTAPKMSLFLVCVVLWML